MGEDLRSRNERRCWQESNSSFAKYAKQGWGTPATFLFRRPGHLTWCLIILFGVAVPAAAAHRVEPTIEELKARIASASVAERARICIQIAQKGLEQVDKLYGAGEISQGQAGLTDVVTYAELARDYSIQSHKHQKQTEIAVRGMTRKLTDLKHTLNQQDQVPVKDTLDRLERVRDDLLASMFKTKEDK